MSWILLGIDPSSGDEPAFFRVVRPIDHVGISLAVVFLLLGSARGLWWQVIRLGGLFGAAVLARTLAPRWSPELVEASGLAPVFAQGIVWFVVFVLGLGAVSVLGLIGKKSLETMQLGLVDRFGGAAAGVLTGLLLHAALLLGISYLGPMPWTADTLRGTHSQTLLRLVATRRAVLLDRDSPGAREIRSWLGTEKVDDATRQPRPGEPPTLSPGESSELPLGSDSEHGSPVEASAPRTRG